MNIEQQVAAYYTREKLEDKIVGLLHSAGKNLEHLSSEDLAAIDEFHLGGREATQALADFMELRPGMHLLDVGCGIGGPARYFGSRGCQVTGIDLTEEFIRTAENLTRMVKLDGTTKFRQASALELPFAAGTFDGAYTIHVCMNIAAKNGVFREVKRVLKPGARFAIYDIMRGSDGPLAFPVPWARTSETSFVASVDDYRQGLQAAGFRIVHQRDRRQFALDFMQRMMAQSASGPPLLGVHVLMGEHAPLMLKNVNMAIVAGMLTPVELVAIAD
ncbi:MAG: class I SAM-dependent methyltransferase [Acidobacteriaceae bacterium]|nr:class I SAM-dependent methyltransferase [Acidobacteriaceae bacterium]